MKRTYFTWAGLVLLIVSCQKGPNPWISKKDMEALDSIAHPAVKNVAFLYKNNVYYAADMDKPVTQITTDGSASKFVKMSHDHSKFAYLDFSNRIAIVDNKGHNITTLTQYTQVKSFDWSADDKTLYVLNNSAISYYGPSMNLPDITFPGISSTTMEATCASVSPNGDLAYVIHWFDFNYGDLYKLVIKPANNGPVETYSDPDDVIFRMDYVNFTSNTTDFVVGYGDPNSQSPRESQLKFFTDLHNYPTITYSGTSTATPIYNSTLNYLVAGAYNSDANTIAPAALYLGEPSQYTGANVPATRILTQYSVTGDNVYTDWK